MRLAGNVIVVILLKVFAQSIFISIVIAYSAVDVLHSMNSIHNNNHSYNTALKCERQKGVETKVMVTCDYSNYKSFKKISLRWSNK